MKIYASWLGLALLVCATPARSQTPDIEEIWAIVQQQQAEIDELKQRLATADAQLAAAEQKVEATGDYLETMVLPEAGSRTQVATASCTTTTRTLTTVHRISTKSIFTALSCFSATNSPIAFAFSPSWNSNIR